MGFKSEGHIWNHKEVFLIPCLSILNGSLDLKAPHMPAAVTSTLFSPNTGSMNHNSGREAKSYIDTGLRGMVLKVWYLDLQHVGTY